MSRVTLQELHESNRDSLSIEKVRPASLAEWDSIWDRCSYSTYFHSSEWSEIWCRYTKKMVPTPFRVYFSDGKSALLPFSCLQQDGLLPALTGERRLYLSSPECTYGGWISTDELDHNHATLLLGLLMRKFNNLFWRLNPYDDVALTSGVTIVDDGETHAINLKIGHDQVVSNMTHSHRRTAKKAVLNGVSVRTASSVEDWQEYYRVYEDSVKRWGNKLIASKYSWELFHEIFKRRSPNVQLWLAIYQGKVISGSLCFGSKKSLIAWNGATIGASLKLGSSTLIKFEQLKSACEKGYDWFDFNPSAGLEGVKSFKERFGAQALRCPIVRFRRKNMRKVAIEKINFKVIEIKKRMNL